MSYPSLKLETKTPKVDNIEELSNREHEEKPAKNFLAGQLRPKSAKGNDKRLSKKKNGRPISAKKTLVNIPSKLTIKPPPDAYLLTRLRPTYISIDKERLYEDNLALKLTLNGFQSENLKFKTRVTQLEKELARKNDIIEELSGNEKYPGHKYIHLVNNLKQSIKEGKAELKIRDEEIYTLKRKMKSTKIMELESQIQSYEEECKRITGLLEEAMNKHSNAVPTGEYDKKFQSDLINTLKKENSELKINLNKLNEELRRIQQERLLEGDKKKKSVQGTQQVTNLKLEVQKLRTQLEGAYKEGKDKENQISSELMIEKKRVEELKIRLENEERKFKDAQKQIEALKQQKIQERGKSSRSVTPKKSPRSVAVIKDIRKVLTKQKISFERFLNAVDKQHIGFIDIEEFLKFFKNFGQHFKKSELEDFFEKKSGKFVINLIKLQKNYEKFLGSPSSSSSSEKPLIPSAHVPVYSPDDSPTQTKNPQKLEKEVEDCLRHISLCMQLHRIKKTQIFETFFSKLNIDKKISRDELGEAIRNPPFAFPQKVSTSKLCDFLIPVNKERNKQQSLAQVKEIIVRLTKILPDWEIFDADEEEQFDALLTKVIMNNKKVIKEKCRALDKRETGTITLEEFKTAIVDFKELESVRVLQYMMLLFYSHEYEIDKVPYIHFIKAYGEQNTEESQEYTEEEKAEIVNHYLTEIAKSLTKQKQAVRDVFQVENSLIYPESFISGLEHLGLKNIEHDFIILILEALQCEKENEACISIEEFETILENFGVTVKRKVADDDSEGSDRGKKISVADSENYEYSDESPERHKISEISPFVSAPNLKQASGNETQGKKEINEKSSKMTLAVSKIEKQSERKRGSSSDSIRHILENRPKDSSSSSFERPKKQFEVQNGELVFVESVEKRSSSGESGKGGFKGRKEGFSESEKYSENAKNASEDSGYKLANSDQEYSEENFENSEKSNPFIPNIQKKPSPQVSSSKSSNKSANPTPENLKKDSYTLGLKEQSKSSSSREIPVNQSRSSKKQDKQDYSENFSSSSSSKKPKNPQLAQVYKEDLPLPSNKDSLPGNMTGSFGSKDPPILPVANPIFSARENDSKKVSFNSANPNSSIKPQISSSIPMTSVQINKNLPSSGRSDESEFKRPQIPPLFPGKTAGIQLPSPPEIPSGSSASKVLPSGKSSQPGHFEKNPESSKDSSPYNYESSSSKEIKNKAIKSIEKSDSGSRNIYINQELDSENSEPGEDSAGLEYFPDASKNSNHHTVKKSDLSKQSEKNISSRNLHNNKESSGSSNLKPFQLVNAVSSSSSDEPYTQQMAKKINASEKFSEPLNTRNKSESYAEEFRIEKFEDSESKESNAKESFEENYENDNFVAEDLASNSDQNEMF